MSTALADYCREHKRLHLCAQRLQRRIARNHLRFRQGYPTPKWKRELLSILLDRRHLQLGYLAQCIKTEHAKNEARLSAVSDGRRYESALLSELMLVCEESGQGDFVHRARERTRKRLKTAA